MTQENVSEIVISGSETMIKNAATAQLSLKGRVMIMIVEVILIVLLAYLIVSTFYSYVSPAPDYTASVQANMNAQPLKSGDISYDTIVRFDPFYRETQSNTVQTSAAPESSLQITIAGLRVGADGTGAAIIDAQGDGQKLVNVGDEITSGVSLSRVYADRIEISRRGVRETVYMIKPSSINRQANNPDGLNVSAPDGQQTDNADFSALLASIRLEPVRGDNQRIKGFRVMDETPQKLLADAGLEAGDIILAVNGSPLTSFERMQELGEELQSAPTITLDIERRGQQLVLAF